MICRCNLPNVGLIVDSFQTLVRKEDPNSIRRIPGDRIFHVQLADAPAIEMDLLSLSRRFRALPGEGTLDLIGFVSAVLATGYRGPFSLEIFRDSFPPGPPMAIECFCSLYDLINFANRSGTTIVSG